MYLEDHITSIFNFVDTLNSKERGLLFLKLFIYTEHFFVYFMYSNICTLLPIKKLSKTKVSKI